MFFEAQCCVVLCKEINYDLKNINICAVLNFLTNKIFQYNLLLLIE